MARRIFRFTKCGFLCKRAPRSKRMPWHAAAAGRETARLNDRVPSASTAAPTTPTASASSAPPPALLTAVSPQQAWSEQLKRAGAADNRGPISTSREGKRGASVSVLTTTGQPKHASPGPKVRESSVDRILSSSIKQHTFSHAPFRVPPSLEAARSPYEPPNGINDPVQIRRDVKDSMNLEEYAPVIFIAIKSTHFGRYPKLRVADVVAPPPPHVYASAPFKETIKSQPWAVALQKHSNTTLANAVREQFCEVDALMQTRAAQYNSDMLAIINRIQHSPSKDEKHAKAVEVLSPHCR
jgi:hypothetical protein